MRKTLLACFVLLSIQSFAQDWSGQVYRIYDIYQGYIINLKGDTTYGYVMHGDRTSNQNSVDFYIDKSDPKTRKTYKPSELKGYMVADKAYSSINYSGGLSSKKQQFVLQVKPGHLSQMVWYLSNSAAEGEQQMVWYREGEAPIQHAEFILGFAKKMSKLTSDYPELSKKVENKEKGYGITRIFNIVDEYNQWWADKAAK